ncbi:hypothetical protein RI129_003319 [Pyrocoelia pectoralis]|uniref:Oxysterol-binding protein n=1 Tax=Pyrocoelia pectoralis TaxID=417401 RepID=A0AAN7ZMW8_9COLE
MDKKFKLSVSNIAIDSDASAETNSLSAESTTENVHPKSKKKFGRRRGSEWEVVEGLKEGQRFEKRPDVYNGFLHKKRKWPLKGWHKRFFVLNKGILIYGKNQNEINKGKIHGSVDIGLSVISSKLTGCRIDIDAEEFIYHLKAKTEDNFNAWLKQLTDHRLYRQHGLTYGSKAGIYSSSQTNEVFSAIKNVVSVLSIEKDTLKEALNQESQSLANYDLSNEVIGGLKNSLKEALHQNADLRRRLKAIHDTSDSSNLSHIPLKQNSNSSLSGNSSCISASEYFDAEDLPKDEDKIEVTGGDFEIPLSTRDSDTSSEAGSFSSNESISSGSEGDIEFGHTNIKLQSEGSKGLTGRRTILPVPRPATEGLSLWNILYKNIGKDLSQISMPVALNEPLNILQRLCEELEYSELLDKAAEVSDPYERMVYVAAFAVSAYASSYSRAGNKPFNPLLGETYECIREDKGFRFLSEQVSHHPPISACHAESKNFIFWQEARVKTKFWGKSMEFQPLGKVHLCFPSSGDTYVWNKVTTCVHSIFSGQRWVDQYGELHITNNQISCKLTFAKSTYWSSKRHEVLGTVYDENGKHVRNLFGKWSEALYCGVAPSARCVWRAGTLPPHHEQFYGFTRFAIELNELEPESHLLPPTDTRLRPDQRALELGNLSKAEQLKLQLENAQRERRKKRIVQNVQYQPLWFSQNENNDQNNDEWLYNGKYWDARKNGTFSEMEFESLW